MFVFKAFTLFPLGRESELLLKMKTGENGLMVYGRHNPIISQGYLLLLLLCIIYCQYSMTTIRCAFHNNSLLSTLSHSLILHWESESEIGIGRDWDWVGRVTGALVLNFLSTKQDVKLICVKNTSDIGIKHFHFYFTTFKNHFCNSKLNSNSSCILTVAQFSAVVLLYGPWKVNKK